MDESAPVTVAAGTVLSCKFVLLLSGIPANRLTSRPAFAGASVAGTYAIARGRGQGVATIFAASAALNCGIAGATFFSLREYAVKPVLVSTLPFKQYARRRMLREEWPSDSPPLANLTWWDMRTHCVPDSMLSGAFTGSILNAWRRGSRGVLPGLAFGALGCSIVQLLYNEVEVQRVKYVSRTLREASTRAAEPVESPETKRPFIERVKGLFGMKTLSDDEYLEQLKADRDRFLTRIAELERRGGKPPHGKT
ncbi:hypothetical protein FA95DRAFT_1600518 [Auriscalpium vulgare]|uniref:Uncharacterized protein n=1 Tax=Auriscalpium vulgare TaxID=40419 RepID=A0ACB8SBY4_9AGAM|nr:hypothetical protein FA95DRAFT_1600518 [Auriscalpium vulgare]